MRILVTNDDGIRAESLEAVVRWAKRWGEVEIIAPKYEQSGKSHSIELHKPFEVLRVEREDGIVAYSVDSSPADCVRFAVLGLGEKYDLIISGINRGFNLGKDIVYSGTCGAIFEGARLGIKGIALSTDPTDYTAAVARLDSLWQYIEREGLLSKNNLYNINIPLAEEGVVYTRQGGIYFSDEFVKIAPDTYEQRGGLVLDDNCDLTLDTDAIRHNYLSITPLTHERTNIPVFESLIAKG